MLQQKISLARIFLLLTIIVSIGVVLGFLSAIGKIGKNNLPVVVNPDGKKIGITTDKTEYGQGEEVKINIKNNTESEAFLTFPAIEVFEPTDKNFGGGEWKTIRTVWTGCGVPGGLLYLPLLEGESYLYSWDQKEKWCAGEPVDTNLNFQDARPGIYRIKSAIVQRIKSVEEYPNNISGQPTGNFLYSNEFIIKEKQEVTITTDKTGYEQGEPVKITITNNKDESIYISPYDSFPSTYFISKFENDKWKRISQNCGCEYTCESGILMSCPQYVPPAPYFREFKSPFTGEWKQIQCASKNQLCGDKPYTAVTDEQVEPGKYKIEFCYYDKKDIDLTKDVDYAPQDKKKCIENEFTIKEKTSEILTIDYVLKHSEELTNKTISVEGTANNNKNRVICTKGPGCNKCDSPPILEEGGQSIEMSGRINNTPVICIGTDCEGIKECKPLAKGKSYVVIGIWNGKSLDIESWTEKSAADLRCNQKVKITGACEGKLIDDIGYQFNSEIGKCIEKVVGGNGCRVETPFSSLEECQKTCENLQVDFYSCEKDSDCISVKAGCCGCNAGGNAKAINKNFKMDWKGECEEIALVMCPAVMSDDPSCFKKPTCVSNKCVLE